MAIVRGRGEMFHAQIVGLKELEAQFARISNFPRKEMTKAAKSGMAGPLKDARTAAPVGKTGMLKRSIRSQRETPNKRNKAVYRLVFSSKFSDYLVKESSGAYGGTPPRAYYPASQEYGFKIKNGFVQGRFFMENAMRRNESRSIQKVTSSLNKSIDDLLK
jgi:hypothetical protein